MFLKYLFHQVVTITLLPMVKRVHSLVKSRHSLLKGVEPLVKQGQSLVEGAQPLVKGSESVRDGRRRRLCGLLWDINTGKYSWVLKTGRKPKLKVDFREAVSLSRYYK